MASAAALAMPPPWAIAEAMAIATAVEFPVLLPPLLCCHPGAGGLSV